MRGNLIWSECISGIVKIGFDHVIIPALIFTLFLRCRFKVQEKLLPPRHASGISSFVIDVSRSPVSLPANTVSVTDYT